jgi:hypothetical protein
VKKLLFIVGILIALLVVAFFVWDQSSTSRGRITLGQIPAIIRRAAQARTALSSKNVPIDFWGKVVDQNDQPLVGVVVKGSVRQWGFIGGQISSTPKYNSTSGAKGSFELHGLKGDVLTLESLEKDGYEAEAASLRSFGYNTSQNITVTSNQPIVFRMWRKGIKEPLIEGQKSFKIVPDGRNYVVDLSTGTIEDIPEAKGDLALSLSRPEAVSLGQKYDWAFSLKAIQGGMAEETDGHSSMYLAPTEGYTNEFRIEQLQSQPRWGDGFGNKRFFVKTREGRVYARIEIEVHSRYGTPPDARFRIKYAANPKGLRILR